MKDKNQDKFKVIRRFLYGKDAIKHGINREALVLSAFKGDSNWPFSNQTLFDCIAYLRCQYHLDPFYTVDRDNFFNS